MRGFFWTSKNWVNWIYICWNKLEVSHNEHFFHFDSLCPGMVKTQQQKLMKFHFCFKIAQIFRIGKFQAQAFFFLKKFLCARPTIFFSCGTKLYHRLLKFLWFAHVVNIQLFILVNICSSRAKFILWCAHRCIFSSWKIRFYSRLVQFSGI